MNQYLIQGIGFLGLLFIVLSFQNNKRVFLLLCLCIGNTLFALHFGLLNAWTGCVINIIAALRTLIFSYRDRKTWAENFWWPCLFLLCFWVFGLKTWDGFYILLPIIAQTLETLGLWSKETKTIRFVNLIPHPLWLVYNYRVGSIAGVITEIIVLTSIFVGIARFDKNLKPEGGS